jgi:two-component system, cell cycle sensor histidine kinase and response regulator CckA
VTSPLRVLLVEDSALDAELVLRELRRAGFAVYHRRVASADELRAALRDERWQIVLSDHALPGWSGTEALAVVRGDVDRETRDLPFVIVSGAIGEETAVEAMRSGAHDYILKDRLGRLVPAIERELREAANRRERRRLEDQVRQAQKMETVGRLASGVAHDFNNLLTCVVGYGGLMQSRFPPDDPRLRYVEGILEAARHGASLTQQLLAFSRKQVMRPVVASLNEVVTETETFLRRLLGEDITLHTELAPDLGTVLIDPVQIQQVIVNLAVNARDAMPAGGALTIATANEEVLEGPRVSLYVTDTGSGMTDEVQAHMFEPFYTTKEGGKGTGLGLSTVYGIVQQSGGTITCASVVGRGTTFLLTLPRAARTAVPGTRPGVGPPAAVQTGTETVLLVEDEDRVRELATEILQRFGYRVLPEGDASGALARAERHGGPIELLLTDVVLPDMSGRELASRLRTVRPGSRVLYTSGYTDEVMLLHGLEAPEGSFLAKPYDLTALLRRVREVLAAPEGSS